MRKLFALALILVLCLTSQAAMAAGKAKSGSKPGKPVTEVKPLEPTKKNVLALTDKYIKLYEPKLCSTNKQAINDINDRLFLCKGLESEEKRVVNSLVNQLTVSLAGLKDFETLTVASVILFQTMPDNPRTANLFASVLHTSNKLDDSVLALRYTLSLDQKSNLAMLNLGNAYLDVNKLDKAKAMAEKVLAKERENMDAHRILAGYWYKKKNMAMFRSELMKSVKFAGYVHKKTERQNKRMDEEEAQSGDSTETLEQKTRQLANEVPATTADIIEDEFPAQAQQIRKKYSKLGKDEKMIMPRLPMINTSTAKNFCENAPIVEAWVQAYIEQQQKYAIDDAERMGIDPNASDAVREAQALAAGKQMMTDQMQQAQDALKYLDNMPGMSSADKAQLKKTMNELKKASKQQGVNLKNKPVDMNTPPGFDSGSALAVMNYANYSKISNTYEIYFLNYYQEFMAKTTDIIRVYSTKVVEENNYHESRMKELEKAHRGKLILPEQCKDCLKEIIRHKKRMNELAEDYYKQWVNLYMPQYAQKMKPTLDAYWNSCMLYIRVMNDPKVMEREYLKVRKNFLLYGSQAISGIVVGGEFKYEGTTDGEEEALRQLEEAARQAAEEKKPEFIRDFNQPESDWTKWIEDHLVLEVSGQFLGLKITATTIEFNAWAFGPGAGIKFDMLNETMETYVGVGARLKVGVNVGGMGGTVEANVDFARKNTKWDFSSGKYEESYSAVGEAKAAFGNVSASGEVELDTQLNAKTTSKINVADTFSIQQQTSF